VFFFLAVYKPAYIIMGHCKMNHGQASAELKQLFSDERSADLAFQAFMDYHEHERDRAQARNSRAGANGAQDAPLYFQ